MNIYEPKPKPISQESKNGLLSLAILSLMVEHIYPDTFINALVFFLVFWFVLAMSLSFIGKIIYNIGKKY